MDSKKLEQLFTPRRKVISGFNLGVGASLILIALLFITYYYSSPVLNPGFYSPAVNSSSENRVANSSDMPASLGLSNTTMLVNLTKEVEDGSSKVEDKEGEGSLGITHMGNTSEVLMGNGSLHVEESKERGNVTEKVKEGVFDSGNTTEISKDDSLHGEVTEVGNGVGNLSMVVKEDVHAEEAVGGSLSKNSSEVTDGDRGSLNQTKEIVIDFGSQSWEGASGIDEKCDIFDGRWERDDSKPYYPGGSCPLVDKVWNCHANRRPDNDFLKWKWQPNHCDIPSLNATDFLERLRGKRLVFVGDSLNRNMWESLVCILRQSVRNKKKVYEISGKTEFKKKGIYSFRFEEYSCSVDFVIAPFLVRESYHKGKNGSFDTLRLDMMDRTTKTYRDADILVFNTGHWWTHEKTSKGEYYYQEGNYVHPRLEALEAYRRALTTWAKWVDTYINVNKTWVFFRGYSVTHFSGGQWNSGGQCHRETEPIFNETYLSHYPSKMRALEHVLQEMKTPVTYLNISRLTDYRKDGHPSIYRTLYKTKEAQIKAELSQDCSHWCLPGVPDTWNELLYALLLQTGWGSRKK